MVADVKHTPMLRRAKDWWGWAAPGPGSIRGLNRLRGYSIAKMWKQSAFVSALIGLRQELKRYAPVAAELCLQDLQNCLCEFDKWERVLHGEGTPRARYWPTP